MKTRTSTVPSIVDFVTSAGRHPYTTPEVISVPIIAGHAPYLDWIGNSVPVPHQQSSMSSTRADTHNDNVNDNAKKDKTN